MEQLLATRKPAESLDARSMESVAHYDSRVRHGRRRFLAVDRSRSESREGSAGRFGKHGFLCFPEKDASTVVRPTRKAVRQERSALVVMKRVQLATLRRDSHFAKTLERSYPPRRVQLKQRAGDFRLRRLISSLTAEREFHSTVR